jgi:HEPN domain-containing protein
MSPDHLAWFAKADEDLSMIEIGLAGGAPSAQMCIHAQQLAEKYLKAFLVRHLVVPPRIHDLERLLDLCVGHDSRLESLRADCILATQLAAHCRYPGWSEGPTSTDVADVVAAARRVRSAVRDIVLPEGEA